MSKHTFELSGLGKAPFTIVNHDHGNQAFFCQHCGTMLKNRFFVSSAEGTISVVGIDCLSKTGDQGLIDGAKRLKREASALAREKKREIEHLERAEQERSRFNGKTHEEVRQGYWLDIKSAKEKAAAYIQEHEIYSAMEDVPFAISVLTDRAEGRSLSNNVVRILAEILAKSRSRSRKNSKAYKSAFPQAHADVNTFIDETAEYVKKIEELQHKMLQHIQSR